MLATPSTEAKTGGVISLATTATAAESTGEFEGFLQQLKSEESDIDATNYGYHKNAAQFTSEQLWDNRKWWVGIPIPIPGIFMYEMFFKAGVTLLNGQPTDKGIITVAVFTFAKTLWDYGLLSENAAEDENIELMCNELYAWRTSLKNHYIDTCLAVKDSDQFARFITRIRLPVDPALNDESRD